MGVAVERTALIALAAGRSSRFGDRDKLIQPVGGRMLGEHVLEALAPLSFAARFLVTAEPAGPLAAGWAGRYVIVAADPAGGAGDSLAAGARAAAAAQHDAALVVLCDMPFVDERVARSLLAALDPEAGVTAAHAGASDRPHPPSAFLAEWLPRLAALSGDAGARPLMVEAAERGKARALALDAAALADVDTPADLVAVRVRIEQRRAAAGAAGED